MVTESLREFLSILGETDRVWRGVQVIQEIDEVTLHSYETVRSLFRVSLDRGRETLDRAPKSIERQSEIVFLLYEVRITKALMLWPDSCRGIDP